jgi:hypothetical protein
VAKQLYNSDEISLRGKRLINVNLKHSLKPIV